MKWVRIFRMYTIYNVFLAFLLAYIVNVFGEGPSHGLLSLITDAVRANSVLIAFGVTLSYIVYGVGNAKRMYDDVTGMRLHLTTWWYVDFMVHMMPMILLGWPKSPVFAFAVAWLCVTVWYASIRKDFAYIYGRPELTLEMTDRFIFIGLPYSMLLMALFVFVVNC